MSVKTNFSKSNAILIFRSAALGDFIISSPAIAEVKKMYPDRKIVLLTIQSASKEQRKKVASYAGSGNRAPWIELARPHLLDNVFILDELSIAALIRLRRELAEFSFEAAVLMLDPAAPWLGRLKKLFLMISLVGLTPIYGWRGSGAFSKDKIALKKIGALTHHVYGPLQFLRELKPNAKLSEVDIKFDLRPGTEATNWAETWIASNLATYPRLVAIAPGAIHSHKQWPIEKFLELISKLLAHYSDIGIVIIGTPNDVKLGAQIEQLATDRIKSIAGKSTILQSAALLQHCDLLIGNDGGAMHLGDAMGAKVISIVPGLEFPDSIEPWNNKKLAIRHHVECAPCYNFTNCPEGHNKCMQELPVEAVYKNCELVL